METPESIVVKMDRLNLWEKVSRFNWCIKPLGTAMPYFCSVVKGEMPAIKLRFLMLEGWQTMHNWVITRADQFAGCYSSPLEFPRLEMVLTPSGEMRLFRYDTGYVPREADARERELAGALLWQSYGVMLRLENDESLILKYADDRAVFSRQEKRPGEWEDMPLEIPEYRLPAEKISFQKDALDKARDLPFVPNESLDLDFRIDPMLMSQDARPRSVYRLVAVDSTSGQAVIDAQVLLNRETGLRELWQSMPGQVLREFLRMGKVPGTVRVLSPRVFRFLRPLCVELPLKLSMHDKLPLLDKIYGKIMRNDK